MRNARTSHYSIGASIIVWATATEIRRRNGFGWNAVLQAEQGRQAGPGRTRTGLRAGLRRNAPLPWCRRACGSGSCGGSSAPSACVGGVDAGDDGEAKAGRGVPPRTNWNAGTTRHPRPPRARSLPFARPAGPPGAVRSTGLGQEAIGHRRDGGAFGRGACLGRHPHQAQAGDQLLDQYPLQWGGSRNESTRVRITSQTLAMVATIAPRTRRALLTRSRALVARSVCSAI